MNYSGNVCVFQWPLGDPCERTLWPVKGIATHRLRNTELKYVLFHQDSKCSLLISSLIWRPQHRTKDTGL